MLEMKLNFSGVTGIFKTYLYKIGAFLHLRVYWGGGGVKTGQLECYINKAHTGCQLLAKFKNSIIIIKYETFIHKKCLHSIRRHTLQCYKKSGLLT